MQKVIRRTVLAERQYARKVAKRKDKNERAWGKSNREQVNYSRKDETEVLKAARIYRREDYELGPLAPKRDVGEWAEKYGTINSQRARGNLIHTRNLDEELKSVGGKFLNIVKGDRVVLLEGRDKGKIGIIRNIDRQRAECTVEGLNRVDVSVPQYMIAEEDPDQRKVRTIEKPVPLNSIRLVYPLTDEETGKTRDVIVKKLVHSKIWHTKEGGARWSRIIPGLNIKVPWPKTEPPQYEDHPNDTLRLEVETKTFVPTLLGPPMPRSVIDELRNKYSIFRTRHDPEYLEAKIAEDREKEAKKKMAEQMRTPLKEVNRRERKMRKAKGKGKLTPNMLERIGRLIAQKKQLAMDAAGVSTETPVAVAA
ncbi:hypothetical protein G7Y89_g12337 [Cudoniella acicularis]|uniref:KOW domain-containing protein n=1 Tax=Cudoniella acicularis TaxID=354080 RepID=A0A8H4VXG0_9HELO|nr:hypothetical protein G7Y89_g12337 [Cudoniella acicularis]